MDNKVLFYCGIDGPEQGLDKFRAEGGQVVYFILPEDKARLSLRAGDKAILWESDQKVKLWLHENPSSWMGAQVSGDEAVVSRLAPIIGEIVNLHNFDQSSLKFLTKDSLPMRNCLHNFRWVEDGVPLARVKGRAKGCSIILILAGPSLNSQWEPLAALRKEASKDTFFILCGRSYRKAMEKGVYPDFVVEVEMFDWDRDIFMFAMPPPRHATLVAPATACPGVFRAWPYEKIVLVDHNLAQLFSPEGMKIGEDSLDGGNSILHHMFNFAAYMDPKEIVLTGCDLGYPEGEAGLTHAEGTFHPWPYNIQRAEMSFQEPMTVTGNDGQPLQSSPGYRNFALFLEMQVHKAKKQNPALIVRTFSPKGQKVNGVDYVDIEFWRKEKCQPSGSSELPLSSQPFFAPFSQPGSSSVAGSNPP